MYISTCVSSFSFCRGREWDQCSSGQSNINKDDENKISNEFFFLKDQGWFCLIKTYALYGFYSFKLLCVF